MFQFFEFHLIWFFVWELTSFWMLRLEMAMRSDCNLWIDLHEIIHWIDVKVELNQFEIQLAAWSTKFIYQNFNFLIHVRVWVDESTDAKLQRVPPHDAIQFNLNQSNGFNLSIKVRNYICHFFFQQSSFFRLADLIESSPDKHGNAWKVNHRADSGWAVGGSGGSGGSGGRGIFSIASIVPDRNIKHGWMGNIPG